MDLFHYQPLQLQTRPTHTQDELNALLITSCLFSTLSIIGSVLNILFISFLKIKGPTTKMVIWISAMSIAVSFPSALQLLAVTENIICQSESFIKFFGLGACFAWSCCFAHALYTAARKGGDVDILELFLKNYMIITTTCGFVYGALGVASVGKKVDTTRKVCLFMILKQSCIQEFAVNTVPSMLGVVICWMFFRKSKENLKLIPRRVYPELFLFPIIFSICVLPRAFREMGLFINIDVPYIFYLLSEIFYECQGLLNSVAFLMSQRVFDAFRKSKEGLAGQDAAFSSVNYSLANSY